MTGMVGGKADPARQVGGHAHRRREGAASEADAGRDASLDVQRRSPGDDGGAVVAQRHRWRRGTAAREAGDGREARRGRRPLEDPDTAPGIGERQQRPAA
jgi:hypothetical protein